jgi:hypothetical protein
MIPTLAAELGKVAVQKLSEVKVEDAARAVRSLSRGSVGAAVLVPGVAAFAAGIALGAGLGVLFAPRAGRETRRAIADSVRSRIRALRSGRAG